MIFESQEDACAGILAGKVKPGDIVIIRNEGPRGGPGMQEMLSPDRLHRGLMKGLDYAEKTYPYIDEDRECALGASYGGYMANWLLGHTDRFKCIVSHDGMFNSVSSWGTTEELWFNQWEYKGTPYSNREMTRNGLRATRRRISRRRRWSSTDNSTTAST